MLTGNYSKEKVFTTQIFYLSVTLCVVYNCINDYLNIIIIFLEKGPEILWKKKKKFHHKPYLVANESPTQAEEIT